MKVELTKQGEICILKTIGRLDASNAKEFKDKFQSYLAESVYFVMDFSEMDFIDSTGLGAIISSLRKVTEMDGDIYIANLQDKPRILFEITRAYKIFEVFDDVETAIQALKNEI